MWTAGPPPLPPPAIPEPVHPGASRTALLALQGHALLALGSPAGADAVPARLYAAAAVRGAEHLEAASDPAAYRTAVRAGTLPDRGRVAGFAVRKRWMADAAAGAIGAGVRQVVVLGGGFDTLALELLGADPDLLVIEADRPDTLDAKSLALATAGIPRPWPRFVAVDLGDAGALAPALGAAGWRGDEPTLHVAEVVLEYLAPEAARRLLGVLGTQAAPENRLACTVRLGDAEDDALAAATAAVGEPMRFRPLAAEVPRLLADAKLDVVASRGGGVLGGRGPVRYLLLAPAGTRTSPNAAEVATRIEAGLRYVAARLGASGQWPSRRHEHADLSDRGRFEISPCITGVGLLALAGLDHPLADEIRRRSRPHLVGTMRPAGLWRYYRDLPDDVDTSSIVALALGDPGHDADAILAGRIPDGRFRIWLTDGTPVPEEIDAVVNANAAAALGTRPETAPAVRWIADVVERGRAPSSWYYRDELDLALAIQRAVDAGVAALERSARASADRAAARIAREGPALPAYRLAQATVAAAWRRPPSHDAALASARALLAAGQRADGSWPSGLLCVGPHPPDPPRAWFASDAVTTALCARALATGA